MYIFLFLGSVKTILRCVFLVLKTKTKTKKNTKKQYNSPQQYCTYQYLVGSSTVDIAKDIHVLYMHTKKDPGKIASHLLCPAHRFTFLLESGLSDTYTH